MVTMVTMDTPGHGFQVIGGGPCTGPAGPLLVIQAGMVCLALIDLAQRGEMGTVHGM